MPFPRNRKSPDPAFRKTVAAAIPAMAVCLAACAGGSADKMYVPENMPDICQELDFRRDKELQEVCGVRSRNYLAYRNVPEHRTLLDPKNGKIVQKGKSLELRLENFLPTPLPAEFHGRFTFGEQIRRELVKSKMDYFEFFPPQATRPEKLMRLNIPVENGETLRVCYTMEPKVETAQRKTGYSGRLLPLTCEDFERLRLRTAGGPSPGASLNP